MIELPEAVTIARQMNLELRGKRILTGNCGNSPHKFAFYSHPPEEYEAILRGKRVGETTSHGSAILIPLGRSYRLVLGGGGERILYHTSEETWPKKRQLLLQFDDGTSLTVTVSGWGNAMLLKPDELAQHPHVGKTRVSPLAEEFTLEYLQGLFGKLVEDDPRSIKYFVISQPGIWGVGNGYLQDILFRAKINPRRRALDVHAQQRPTFHAAILETLRQAVELGGRDTERDLYNRPGGYKRILDHRMVGEACPKCETPIEKIRFLGGASYFCPKCQT